jgi:Kdo2-lipid IVA lauroyltransferase/acyltransferase
MPLHWHASQPKWMSKSNLQIQLEYLLVRFLLAVFRAIPLSAGLWLGPARGGWAFASFGRLRRTGRRNLQLAFPDWSERQRLHVLRDSFRNLGRLLAVFSHFNGKDLKELRSLIDCEGLEHIDAARADGKAVILFTGHLGAWELTSFALSMFGHPLSFLVRRIDNSKIEALVDRARTRLGNRTIDKRAAAREMLQTLQAGETLGILVDLNTHEREGIFVDFFGVPASTTFALAKLALRTGATVLPVFAPWDERQGRFLLKVDRPLAIEKTGNEETDVRRLTQQFTSVVEDYVRKYPDQWLWIHRRWRIRPEGQPDLYK